MNLGVIRTITEASFCLIDVILLYRFSLLFLKKKGIESTLVGIYSLLSASIAFGFSLLKDYSMPITIILFVLTAVYVCLIFAGTLRFKLIVALSYYLLFGLFTTFVSTSAMIVFTIEPAQMFDDLAIRISIALMIKLLLFILIELINRLYKGAEVKLFFASRSVLYFFSLSFITLLLIFEATFLGKNFERFHLVEYMSVIFGLLFILVILFMIRYYRSREKLLEMQILLDEAKTRQQADLKETEHSINVLKAKHDMRNHLIALRSLMEQKSIEKALLYIKAMESMDAFKTYVHTDNQIIDALLNAKISSYPDIDFSIRLDIQSFSFKSHYLSVLLGNTIDNAIEAVEKLPEEQRFIKITITENQQYGKIVVENPYDGQLKIVGQKLYSSKREDSVGLGLMSVECALKECQGIMKYSTENNQFHIAL